MFQEMNNINVEVIGENGQYCLAFLKHLDQEDAIVAFVNEPDVTKKVPRAKVRLAADHDLPQELTLGLEVDVKLPSATTTPPPSSSSLECPAWWPAKIEKMRGEVFIVKLKFNDRTEIVDRDQLRPSRKGEEGDSLEGLHSHVIQLPKELSECAADMSLHNIITKFCGPALLFYDKTTAQLQILTSKAEVIHRVTLIEESHIRFLRQKIAYLNETGEVRRYPSGGHGVFVEQFSILEKLMGLAIGSKGVNIVAARQIPGVRMIEVDDETSSFRVHAESAEAAAKARQMLEFAEERMMVPQDVVAQIIGKAGANIQTLIDKAGVVRVFIDDPQPATDAEQETEAASEPLVPFVFVGTAQSIKDARILVNFNVENLKEVEKLQEEKDLIVRELHQSDGGPSWRGGGRMGGIFRGRGRGSRTRDERSSSPPPNDWGRESDDNWPARRQRGGRWGPRPYMSGWGQREDRGSAPREHNGARSPVRNGRYGDVPEEGSAGQEAWARGDSAINGGRWAEEEEERDRMEENRRRNRKKGKRGGGAGGRGNGAEREATDASSGQDNTGKSDAEQSNRGTTPQKSDRPPRGRGNRPPRNPANNANGGRKEGPAPPSTKPDETPTEKQVETDK